MINARQSDGQGVSNQQLFDWKRPSGVNMSTIRLPSATVPILAPLAPIALICLRANQFSGSVRSNTKYSAFPVQLHAQVLP